MDTFAAMALATEEPSDALLDQRPYSRTDSIFTPVMYRNIIGQAIFQIIVFCSLLFYFRYDHVVYDFIYEDTDDCKWFNTAEIKFREQWIDPYTDAPNDPIHIKAKEYLTKDRGYECGYKTSDLP